MMNEQKCYKCARVLFIQNEVENPQEKLQVEIICPGCRYINYIGATDPVGLRGKDFQSKSIDLRCKRCGKLHSRAIGDGVIAFKCWKCGIINEYDTQKVRSGEQAINFKKDNIAI